MFILTNISGLRRRNRVTKTAVIDMDLYKYHAAAAGEKRSVKVVHKQSGRELIVPTRTDFYGDWRKKEGGKLAEINKAKSSGFAWDDFDYFDIQEPEPIANVLHTAKVMVEKDLKLSGAKNYIAFLGEGESFRVGLSTIQKYKDRENLLKPVLLDEVTEYLRKKFKAEIVTEIENDDRVVIECYNHPDRFALIEDKDFWGCPINVWDRNQQERGIVNCNKFGYLFLDEKGKVRGEGRIFFYWQVAAGDATDGYSANSASDVRWGDKSAYHALVECKNDKEALQSLVSIYKNLYPESKNIIGWRGDEIELDWLYVASENWHLARMLRTYDELTNKIELKDVLERMKLI